MGSAIKSWDQLWSWSQADPRGFVDYAVGLQAQVCRLRDHAKRLEKHRHAWTALRIRNAAAGTKALRTKAPALYAWLYRNGRVWLKAHQPARMPPTISRPRLA